MVAMGGAFWSVGRSLTGQGGHPGWHSGFSALRLSMADERASSVALGAGRRAFYQSSCGAGMPSVAANASASARAAWSPRGYRNTRPGKITIVSSGVSKFVYHPGESSTSARALATDSAWSSRSSKWMIVGGIVNRVALNPVQGEGIAFQLRPRADALGNDVARWHRTSWLGKAQRT